MAKTANNNHIRDNIQCGLANLSTSMGEGDQ